MKLRRILGALRRRLLSRHAPPPGTLNWGDLRSGHPFCSDFGSTRGRSIDRFFIEHFLDSESTQIKGHVLELLRDTYTTRYGRNRVTRVDILNLNPGPPETTIVANLANCPEIPDESFDTIILTQALQFIPDLCSAAKNLHRLLKPGGVLLLTVPAVSADSAPGNGEYADYWRFHPAALRWLFGQFFRSDDLQVAALGNLVTATAFLHGFASEDLTPSELSTNDGRYPVIVTLVATKQADFPTQA